MSKAPFHPLCRAMSGAAPRIRLVTMKSPSMHLNRMWGPGQIELEAKEVTFTIQGPMTPENMGWQVIASLMSGELGRHVTASENNKDCILGVVEFADIEGPELTMYLAIAREEH